ncbi:MAG: dihydrolipoamide acetyltransferase family protein [Myxococcota bacterium]
MGFEFKLPDIGEGVTEGEIVKWLVKPGDQVEVDQPLVEVMTDKATVEIASPKAGTVLETRGGEGDVAAVGSVIVVLETGAAAAAAPQAAARGGGPAVAPLPSKPPAPVSEAPPVAAVPDAGAVQVLAAPATRRLARELGVDLGQVSGTGPAGRVTSEDVRRSVEKPVAPLAPVPAPRPAPAAGPGPATPDREDEVVPVRGVRRRIWEGMTRSAFSAPHFTFVEECDVTELVASRKRLNSVLGEDDVKLTFLPFIVKAVCVALETFPELNGQVDEANQAFVKRRAKHIGIAVAADKGLTVPVVRNAERRSLVDLAREIRRVGDAVRAGSIAPGDLGGSTFTVTSLGKDGGLLATPILNHPEVGILGVHRLQKRPMVADDESIVVRSMMNLSLSCDHRLIDGHVAARFTYRVIELLSTPDRLFLEG